MLPGGVCRVVHMTSQNVQLHATRFRQSYTCYADLEDLDLLMVQWKGFT